MSDFIVIGGGIAGLSAAARLSALGRVTLLERERGLGYHASGRSAALFESNYGKGSTIALNHASRAYHIDAGVLSPRGILMIGTAQDAAHFEADRATMKLDRIGMDAALKLFPILDPAVVDRAAYHSDAWDIDTDRLMQGFARTLTGNGGTIHTNCGVTQINRTRTGWDIRTTTMGTLGARVLVNAAGAWADELAQMAGVAPIGLTPLRRSMARIRAPAGHDVKAWPMLFGPGETWYAKPDAGALLVSPADEHPSPPMDAYADDMVLAEGLDRYARHVTAEVTRLLTSWAGLRTFSPDRELVIGPDPADPAFVWCAGQGGYGMQSSPGASALLGDILASRPPAIGADMAARLSPARFR